MTYYFLVRKYCHYCFILAPITSSKKKSVLVGKCIHSKRHLTARPSKGEIAVFAIFEMGLVSVAQRAELIYVPREGVLALPGLLAFPPICSQIVLFQWLNYFNYCEPFCWLHGGTQALAIVIGNSTFYSGNLVTFLLWDFRASKAQTIFIYFLKKRITV